MKYEKSSPLPSSPMETLGEFFRHARERQGLSLDQVGSQTRIPPRHLQALEEEDFASLPAKVFTKGFVRSYARALGLEEDEALQLFLVSSGSFYEGIQQDQKPHIQLQREAIHRSSFNWNLVLILVLSLGAALFFLLPEQEKIPQPPLESTSALPPHSQQESEPILAEPPASISSTTPIESGSTPVPPSPDSLPAAIPEAAPLTSTPSVPPVTKNAVEPGDLVLEMEATQLTWVVVQSDHQPPHEALLQPGQRISWTAQNQFVLTLGNAAGVVIRLNGESRGPFGKPGEVVRNILIKP